jgi:hypothetical protein
MSTPRVTTFEAMNFNHLIHKWFWLPTHAHFKVFFNVGQLFNVVPIICKFLDQIYGHLFSDFHFAKRSPSYFS